LVVKVGNEFTLDKNSIIQYFNDFKDKLNEYSEEVDLNYIEDCFKSVETIIKPDFSGEQEITNFGRIDWFMRVAGDVEWKKVAIARENGMFVTRQAPGLDRFTNLKPFDLFVCVTGKGSATLKSIENPEHNNFQFDRIDDLDQRNALKRQYQKFTKEVREVIKLKAELSQHEEIIIDELKDLFSDITENSSDTKGKERSSFMQISNGFTAVKTKLNSSDKFKPGDGKPNEVPGSGERSGKNKAKTKGGTLPSENGKLKTVAPSKPRNPPPNIVRLPLSGLRMRESNTDSSKTLIFFDSPIGGKSCIEIFESGEIGNDPLELLLEGKKTYSIEVNLEEGKRECIEVTFVNNNKNFAIEAIVYGLES
jgi:hypothetical protein